MAGKKARRPADGSYSDAWRNASKIILRPGIRMMMRLDWHGQENIPADGPVILAANHLSYMDIFAVSLFADSARRYPVFLAKSSLFTIPVVGTIITRLGQLPVYRGQADAALVLKQAAELAARNSACVIFYPEATVTRDPRAVADGRQDRRGPAGAGDRTSRSCRSRTGARSGSCRTASSCPSSCRARPSRSWPGRRSTCRSSPASR